MPMFISNTKLQYKPKLFFHCRPPLMSSVVDTYTNKYIQGYFKLWESYGTAQRRHHECSRVMVKSRVPCSCVTSLPTIGKLVMYTCAIVHNIWLVKITFPVVYFTSSLLFLVLARYTMLNKLPQLFKEKYIFATLPLSCTIC